MTKKREIQSQHQRPILPENLSSLLETVEKLDRFTEQLPEGQFRLPYGHQTSPKAAAWGCQEGRQWVNR